jgi:hypothetical protein
MPAQERTMILLLAPAALAEPVGFYHPEDIAPRSELFAEASANLSGPFEQRAGALEQLAVALRHYREALDLLGDRAPQAERERLEAIEKSFHRQEAELQAFADALVGDFDGAMRGAMERAAASYGEAMRCQGQIAAGPRVPGMPVKTQKNPECQGRDLNADIAAAMDADAELKAVVDEVLGREWPAVTFPEEPQAPVGAGEQWLSVRDLLVAGARDALRAIDREDDQARMAVEAALEQGDADLEALKATVTGIEQRTAEARAALAAPLLALAEARLAKLKEPPTAWCANPRLLGGCTATDRSTDLVGKLLDDKKFAKALP